MRIYRLNSAVWRTVFELPAKEVKIKELEAEMSAEGFWRNRQKAQLDQAKEVIKESFELLKRA
ncbi:MAG: hypothetical protein AAB642_00560 [Patescibacteria group bacterium]